MAPVPGLLPFPTCLFTPLDVSLNCIPSTRLTSKSLSQALHPEKLS